MQFDAFFAPDQPAREVGIEVEGGLTYNADRLCIEGTYTDELSQHRAKKTWCTILETDFLLIPEADFHFDLIKNPDSNRFQIACSFRSACGRYAFWRLINEQVPEVQFLLETAHLSHRMKDYTTFMDTLDTGRPERGERMLDSVCDAIKGAVKALKRLVLVER